MPIRAKKELLVFAHRGEAIKFISNLSMVKNPDCEFPHYRGQDCDVLLTGEGHENLLYVLTSFLSDYRAHYSRAKLFGVCGILRKGYSLFQPLQIRTIYRYQEDGKFQFKSFTTLENDGVDIISSPSRVLDEKWKEKLSMVADVVDRESWAFSFVCEKFKISYGVNKVPSDFSNSENFCDWVQENSKKFSEVLFDFYKGEIHSNVIELNEENGPESILSKLEGVEYFTESQKRRIEKLFSKISQNPKLDSTSLIEELRQKFEGNLSMRPKQYGNLVLETLESILYPNRSEFKKEVLRLFSGIRKVEVRPSDNFENYYFQINAKIKNQKDLDELQEELKKIDLEPLNQKKDYFKQ